MRPVVATTRPTFEVDYSTCGADSFMLRDGVCDETANNAKCLFDGGDCCKENKDKALCRDCNCILKVDQDNLQSQFEALEIKPVESPDMLATFIGDNQWTVVVDNVVSVGVCTVLCLEHNKADEINAWQYVANKRVCRCGWVHSASQPEKMVMEDWQLESADFLKEDNDGSDSTMPNAFVQLIKTIPFGKFVNAHHNHLIYLL